LLDIRGLTVRFATRGGAFTAVDGVDLQVDTDEVLAIVGESGSGKSVAMLAIMGLLPWTATVSAERLAFAGQDLRALGAKQRRALIGRDIAMVFQEPMSSLNPCFTVGWQIGESLATHLGMARAARKRRVIELLELVGIPDPARRAGAFPHQLSGGMSQRVMIAMALACQPRLLIADEPTTALDVTIQAQILDLLLSLRRGSNSASSQSPVGTPQRDGGMALVLITHDLGVVAETADRVLVQYAGRQVESARAADLFSDPHHPYTAALLAALPEQAHGKRLAAIPGLVPGQFDRPPGCLFAPRCAFATDLCRTAPAPAGAALGRALCHTPLRHGQPWPAAQPLP
jgi:dipeptide transport system ATP-binding protein